MTARVRALGITVELGDPFPCILPGHEVHDAHVHPDGRHWRYSCGTGGRSGMLGEIRARIAYGEDCYVSRVEGARWGERLDHEAGLLNPAAVPLEAPRGASDALRRVIEGLVLMLGLRKAGGKFADEEFVFARRFVMAYCDVTDRQARHAIYRLEKGLGLIERVGGGAHSRDPIRWRLATATKVVNLADRRTA